MVPPNQFGIYVSYSIIDDSEYVDPFNPPNLDTGNAFPTDYKDYGESNDYDKDYTNNIGDYDEQYDAPDYDSHQQTIEANSRVGLEEQQPEVRQFKQLFSLESYVVYN